ncbi:uncharacterized protein LOC107368596 [Tetranychus urticae]|uniref:Uncharacterized protein n=1 Tax=Tetranychus urticae TaxID=32264 RepID=T1KYZ0_TETUR|nr:uncharacterized protein LOC107368596 [Tetranychus urticae]
MMISHIAFIGCIITIASIPTVTCSIWCYSCVSTQPGCGDDGVDWWLHSSITCPKDDDMCVKVIERRDGEALITRDCLSNLIGIKTNIPGDTFEGCRPAAPQKKLANYVENSVIQFDLQRKHWTNTTYCFCQLEHWCNSSSSMIPTILLIPISLAFYLLIMF